MASETEKITKDQIEAGFKENPFGAGVAWIDRSGKKPLVRWKKGIGNADEVEAIIRALPADTPYVAHFRIPTEGLEEIELTHPFPISAGADIAFEGSTPGSVLFHNGGWGAWRIYSLDTCKSFGVRLPKGQLNDSRMMAWNAHFYGEEVLQLINEKALVFGLNEDGTVKFQLYGLDKQNGWNFKGDRTTAKGIWFSNDRWEKHLPKEAPPVINNLRDIKRLRAGRGGDQQPQAGSFQPNGELGDGGGRLPGREPLGQQVEGRQEGTHEGAEQTRKLINSPKLITALAKVHQDEDALANALQINPKRYTRRTAGFLAANTQIVH
jgi:hypothetical protein